MAATKILLIEDDLDLGELITLYLTKDGFAVTYFCRARLMGDDAIVMDVNGVESVLHPERYDIALIDGRLKGSPIDGPDLVGALVRSRLPVVGISGDNWFNRQMVEAGAATFIPKHEIFCKSLSGELPRLLQAAG